MTEAVAFQRDLHVKEEEDSQVDIRDAGGEIIELTLAEQHEAFVAAVTPIYGEARNEYSAELLSLVDF